MGMLPRGDYAAQKPDVLFIALDDTAQGEPRHQKQTHLYIRYEDGAEELYTDANHWKGHEYAK